jgi:membrane-associated protease RseP (regulator of RpoE activity)
MEHRTSVPWEAFPARPVAAAPAGRLPVLNIVLFLLTALTMTLAGALQMGIDPITEPALLVRGLPFAATLMAILATHEAGHYLMCVRYGISASLPYFLPGPPLPAGTFGAFIRIRSRFPDRRALFDVGAAGPLAGFVTALVATVYGLSHSTVLQTAPDAPIVLGDSLLMTVLVRLVLGADPATVVLSPIAYAGWFGFLVTSLNLLPIGQLDGGHVLYAAVGRSLRFFPALLIAFLFWLGLGGWKGWIVWAVIATLLLSIGHPTTDDDAQPLGSGRRLATLLTFVVFVLTFVAEPFRIVL